MNRDAIFLEQGKDELAQKYFDLNNFAALLKELIS
jgi:hypothetical protein